MPAATTKAPGITEGPSTDRCSGPEFENTHNQRENPMSSTIQRDTVTPELGLPAWATEAHNYWEGREQGYDVPWRIVRRVGHVGPWEVEVNAVQKIDGSLEDISIELGDLDGRPLDGAPVARIRELAAFLTSAAEAIEGGVDR